MEEQTLDNGVKTATCKICGQTVMLSDEAREAYPTIKDPDELASMNCQCEGGEKWREAKKQEANNNAFVKYAEHGIADFMRDNGYKRVLVVDEYGNTASLLRMEKGDIKITTSPKKII